MTWKAPVAEVRDAEVTTIGGGAVGCAVAYVLARAGYRDNQVLEQGELARATSGRPPDWSGRSVPAKNGAGLRWLR